MARRELGYGIDEWRALPWWQRRVYVDALNDDAGHTTGESDTGWLSQLYETGGTL